MREQRRLNPRLEIELPAEYRIDASDRPRQGTIANISVGGAAIKTSSQIPPKAMIQQFRFSIPTGDGSEDTLEAAAVVVHARPYKTEDGDIGYFSGLHFLGFDNHAYRRLESFVLDRIQTADPS